MIFAIILATAGLIVLLAWPSHPSLAEEERELREYFRRRDAAEKRGERYPP